METVKIFDLFTAENVKVEDPSLRRYINLDAKTVLKSRGKIMRKFGKIKINVIERLINLLQVPGHRGKKHKIMTFHATGKFSKKAMAVIKAFKIIEQQTKQNPVQVFVKAVENAAPCDEITVIEYGGARYPQAVDVSPMRRLNIALRNIVHGTQDKCFNKKVSLPEALAAEIIAASQNSNESSAVSKRNETEKMADSAR